jgi:acetylornithine deacetylase
MTTTFNDPLVHLLADLVSVPSMNPMGRERSGPHYEEAVIADHVAAVLRGLGADVERQEVSPGRPNIIGRIQRGAPATVLLEAHLDTVPADAMTIEPFTPVVRDGRLYGRGACDTKGSLAAMLFAVSEALKHPVSLRYNVVLAAVADEEFRFTGAREAVSGGLEADFGIAGEPTQLRIVRAHKGVTRWRIVAEGKAAHSAYPDRGTNAIYRMAPALVRLEEYAGMLRSSATHDALGPATLSVGVIEGGEAVNIVPHRCVIDVDRRTLPGEAGGEIHGAIRELLGDLPGIVMEEPYLNVPGMDVPETAPVVSLLGEAIRSVRGTPVIETAPYATDAGIYNRAGIPTVVFGPGDITRAHTADEYIELDQLHQASRILTRLLTS